MNSHLWSEMKSWPSTSMADSCLEQSFTFAWRSLSRFSDGIGGLGRMPALCLKSKMNRRTDLERSASLSILSPSSHIIWT